MLIKLQVNGYAETTLRGISEKLNHLSKYVDLDNPEQVKTFIASKDVSKSFKKALVDAYSHYVNFCGLVWEKPIYRPDDVNIKVPLEQYINLLMGKAS